jgi:hypothetical protein
MIIALLPLVSRVSTIMSLRRIAGVFLGVVSLSVVMVLSAGAAQPPAPVPSGHREFRPGSITRSEDLPAGRLRTRIEGLSTNARTRAVTWLRDFHFTDLDLNTLHADPDGGIYYEDPADLPAEPITAVTEPVAAAASVPVSPFPAALVFHSRPGSANVLFLNFAGDTISGTSWNTSVGRTSIPAVAFSSDADLTTYSDSEQAVIKRVWERVAEDYAAFNIDVTTARPATFNNRTAMALITRHTDANGANNPSSTSGGVAYVNVFAGGNYATYRPAWIYADNLGNNEAFIGEAAAHEIGHNMGLSHDGRTDGQEYYGGHGSGETSWGPIMGTGYNRNVSQWSKGDYYLANNTQDDLSVIAAKLSYRSDDHGDTAATATALVLTGGTNIVSTTPETDPSNSSPANKGVLERNTDVDMFSFITGAGTISLAVNAWISPADSRGGDIDLQLDLYDGSGTLVLSTNPVSQTSARITATLPEGAYFLRVSNVGVGDPFSSAPTGYTAYGGVGQYFISGYVVPSGYVAPPQAEAILSDLTGNAVSAHEFTVTYTDNLAVDVSSLDSSDLRITGPNGYAMGAHFVGVDNVANGSPRVATYAAPAPNGSVWTPADNGLYSVELLDGTVSDTEGATVAGKILGQFTVAVSAAVYVANMDTDPGWTFGGQWAYGTPNYSGAGPAGGDTGSKIIGYNLNGNYANNVGTVYATTPQIDCGNAASLTLRFRRWLGLSNRDTALIQVSTNGSAWTSLWSTKNTVNDGAWQEIQYALPAWTAGSHSLQLRWGLSSGSSGNSIGWNIDDVEILSGGALDTLAPTALLSVANITTAGSPSHSFSVTYSDNVAVSVASLGDGDLLVTGPNGYSNLVAFAGADSAPDGSPRTATYSVPAPNGVWSLADNGTYQITLLEGAVTDIYNNSVGETVLGAFTVAIPEEAPFLIVSPSVFSVAERDTNVFQVRLSSTPAAPITVVVAHISGSTNLIVESGATNVLDASNWSTGATVVLGALPDPDQLDGDAVFSVTATGLANVSVFVTELDTTSDATLIATVNDPAWGSVTPTNLTVGVAAEAILTATPAPYYEFVGWSGDASGSDNPLTLTVRSNLLVEARFAELVTTNHPTPQAWLAENGAIGDFESAVDLTGANGLPLWKSYIAGLDPQDPASQLRLRSVVDEGSGTIVLSWDAVAGRVYSLWSGTNLLDTLEPLIPLEGWAFPTRSSTNSVSPEEPLRLFRLEVWLP